MSQKQVKRLRRRMRLAEEKTGKKASKRAWRMAKRLWNLGILATLMFICTLSYADKIYVPLTCTVTEFKSKLEELGYKVLWYNEPYKEDAFAMITPVGTNKMVIDTFKTCSDKDLENISNAINGEN